MKRLKDITGPGYKFAGYALIRSSAIGQAKNQSNFLTLELVDGDASIEAKLWECEEEDAKTFGNETMIAVKGEVTEYRGNTQLKIEKIRLLDDRDSVSIEEFIPGAPEATSELVKELEETIETIQKPILKEITERLYNKNKERFIVHAAATKNHHNYRSGILFHVVSMLRMGKYLSTQYSKLDYDLVVSGIICHDIGKLEELSPSFIAPEYTRKRLLGHIAIGALWIDREVQLMRSEGREITVEEEYAIDELMHIVLSHHGNVSLGWGSTVDPMTLEANFVHNIDNMDAKHEMLRAGLENKEEGEFHKIWPIGTFLKR